jgi:hypothetical protein
MTVVNVPAGTTVTLNAGAVTDPLRVYCVGPGQATFGITVLNPPVWIMCPIQAGNTMSFNLYGLQTWIMNNGPSQIQLLYGNLEFEGDSIEETEGVSRYS